MIEFDPILVHEWLRRCAKRFPDKVALICGQQRLTYRSINERSDRLAHALIDAGVERHDRVVVLRIIPASRLYRCTGFSRRAPPL